MTMAIPSNPELLRRIERQAKRLRANPFALRREVCQLKTSDGEMATFRLRVKRLHCVDSNGNATNGSYYCTECGDIAYAPRSRSGKHLTIINESCLNQQDFDLIGRALGM